MKEFGQIKFSSIIIFWGMFYCFGKNKMSWLFLLIFSLLYRHNCSRKKKIFFHPFNDPLKDLQGFWRFLKKAIKVYEVMFFWHGKVYLFWKFIQYTIHWDKTQIFKKNLSDKTDLTKMYSFLFRELQHITLLLLIRNSYTSWSTMFISLEVSWDFPFSIPFVFIKLYFFPQKAWALVFRTL